MCWWLALYIWPSGCLYLKINKCFTWNMFRSRKLSFYKGGDKQLSVKELYPSHLKVRSIEVNSNWVFKLGWTHRLFVDLKVLNEKMGRNAYCISSIFEWRTFKDASKMGCSDSHLQVRWVYTADDGHIELNINLAQDTVWR